METISAKTSTKLLWDLYNMLQSSHIDYRVHSEKGEQNSTFAAFFFYPLPFYDCNFYGGYLSAVHLCCGRKCCTVLHLHLGKINRDPNTNSKAQSRHNSKDQSINAIIRTGKAFRGGCWRIHAFRKRIAHIIPILKKIL